MRAAVIAVCAIGMSWPAAAQWPFGPDQPVQCGTTQEEKSWRALVIRQLREHVPKLDLGRGQVTIRFQVDYAGRVSQIKFEKYENNAQALVAAGVISSLKLPPPPDSVDRSCRFFEQAFRFH
jgi:hypothetical protein